MTLHIFNPEHDLALAADSPFWTPPHAARQLRSDLSWLPALWAEAGDSVLVSDIAAAKACEHRAASALGRSRHVTFIGRVNGSVVPDKVSPWGWDTALVQQLQKGGLPVSALPSPDTLRRQRELSDRRTSQALLARLCQSCDSLTGQSASVEALPALRDLHRQWGAIVLKAPWSSSGRGVRFISTPDIHDSTLRWAESVIRKQGHIMVEQALDKAVDFGMEFTALADGTLRYDGLSLFATRHGAYTGSVLATEAEKEEELTRYAMQQPVAAILATVRTLLTQWLAPRLRGVYAGPLGVDMMIVRSADGYRINPCVEINLRRTMGHVALALSPASPGHRRLMHVGFVGKAYHLRIINDHEILV